jgi:hypothetical protein
MSKEETQTREKDERREKDREGEEREWSAADEDKQRVAAVVHVDREVDVSVSLL